MLGNLDPAKMLIVLVLVLVVVGPDRLPKYARQAGSLWHDLTRVRQQVVDEVRSAVPELDQLPSIPRLKPGSISGFLNDLTRSPGAAGAVAVGGVLAGAAVAGDASQRRGETAGEVVVTGEGGEAGTGALASPALGRVVSPPLEGASVDGGVVRAQSRAATALTASSGFTPGVESSADDPAMN